LATTKTTEAIQAMQAQINGSTPVITAKLHDDILENLAGAGVSPLEHDSEDLAADVAAHAAIVQALRTEVKNAWAAAVAAVKLSETAEDFTEVQSKLDAARVDAADLFTRVVAALTAAMDLLARRATELKPLAEAAEANAETIVADVKAGLTTLGSGLEAQIAYGKNLHAAQEQFDFAARRGNVKSRAAMKAAAELRTERDAAAQRAAEVKRQIQNARSAFMNYAVRAAAA
jgi:hypothetical protein